MRPPLKRWRVGKLPKKLVIVLIISQVIATWDFFLKRFENATHVDLGDTHFLEYKFGKMGVP